MPKEIPYLSLQVLEKIKLYPKWQAALKGLSGAILNFVLFSEQLWLIAACGNCWNVETPLTNSP
jgi:hypothetical protein